MAGETVVREELWFDSADGTSRVHGYVWWPPGVIDERDDDASDEAGTDHPARQAAEDRPCAVPEGDDEDGDVDAPEMPAGHYRPRHAAADDATAPNAPAQVDETSPHKADDASAARPTSANALEAAARSVVCGCAFGPPADDEPADAANEAGDTAASASKRHDDDASSAGEPAPEGPPELAAPSAAEPPEDDAVLVKGIVQLVHGMAEHIGRYDEFARFLADNGYIVCGHDHVGHGHTSPRERLGCLPVRGGRDILVADAGRLRAVMQDRLGDELPYFVFGHSLGSFVVRAYLADEGEGLAGAVICGTGHVPPAKSAMGNLACRLVAALRGQDAKSALLTAIGTGPYARAVSHPRTKSDWLSYRNANVDAYLADELCGFPFSAGGYATVTALTREVCAPAWADRVPRALPMLFIGGDADPVGDDGRGVRTSAELVRGAGCTDVTCMIYPHMRHEILNEDERQTVFDDVLFWLEVRS